MDVRNCARCNKVFRSYGGQRHCLHCIEEDRKEFESVRDYLKNNANATMMEISKETGVSPNKIREYIRDGRLVVTPQDVSLKCESCGKTVDQGRFCSECAHRMRNDFRRGIRTDLDKPAASPQRDSEESKVVWNRFRRR